MATWRGMCGLHLTRHVILSESLRTKHGKRSCPTSEGPQVAEHKEKNTHVKKPSAVIQREASSHNVRKVLWTFSRHQWRVEWATGHEQMKNIGMRWGEVKQTNMWPTMTRGYMPKENKEINGADVRIGGVGCSCRQSRIFSLVRNDSKSIELVGCWRYIQRVLVSLHGGSGTLREGPSGFSVEKMK